MPLLKLLRKKQRWIWEDEQREAFEKLKNALTTAPVLARPNFSKPFYVQCDASGSALGAVLVQEYEDGEHPILYISRALSAAERNYTTTERECLALVWSLKRLRPYLEGYVFTAVTDHSALKWLRTMKEPTGRLARWALELQHWNFDIVHRKGAMHKVPDALSRMFDEDDVEVAEIGKITDQWYIGKVQDVIQYPRKHAEWKVEDGLLYRHKRDPLLDPFTDGREG